MIVGDDFFEQWSDACCQVLVTAIGTRSAPNNANIFMAGFEESSLKKLKFKPYLGIQYLDKIFCTWTERLGLDFFKTNSTHI